VQQHRTEEVSSDGSRTRTTPTHRVGSDKTKECGSRSHDAWRGKRRMLRHGCLHCQWRSDVTFRPGGVKHVLCAHGFRPYQLSPATKYLEDTGHTRRRWDERPPRSSPLGRAPFLRSSPATECLTRTHVHPLVDPILIVMFCCWYYYIIGITTLVLLHNTSVTGFSYPTI
jgi:hypothetical protein